MFSPQVTLKSGGYMVINPTEALVSIDVNSGRSTREHNIEDTALQTNLEAAEEVARQLRLRDLAGLIVIDFIDMEEKRNNRAVERRLNDALKNDRARIQVGRISHFGLLEMSRQRIRTGVLESTTTVCPTCQGTGHVRAPASVALHVLRSLEDQLLKGVTHHLTIRTRTPVALYILNQKRSHLSEIEQRFGLHITVAADETITNGAHFVVERGEPVDRRADRLPQSITPDSVQPDVGRRGRAGPRRGSRPSWRTRCRTKAARRARREERASEDGVRRRKRRRRRRGGDGERGSEAAQADDVDETDRRAEAPTRNQVEPSTAGDDGETDADGARASGGVAGAADVADGAVAAARIARPATATARASPTALRERGRREAA